MSFELLLQIPRLRARRKTKLHVDLRSLTCLGRSNSTRDQATRGGACFVLREPARQETCPELARVNCETLLDFFPKCFLLCSISAIFRKHPPLKPVSDRLRVREAWDAGACYISAISTRPNTHLLEASVDMLYFSATELGDTGQLVELLRSVTHYVTEEGLHVILIGNGCRQKDKAPGQNSDIRRLVSNS